MTLTELIAALEAADGPSRELDAQIALAHGWDVVPIREKGGHTWDRWYRPYMGKRYPVRLPNYTSSIDAALTLVPEGYGLVIDVAGEYASASIYELRSTRAGPFVKPARRTPALALCIAALKAREASA